MDYEAAKTELHQGSEYLTHPAFGKIQVSRTYSGRGESLFGSQLKHNTMLHITISNAAVVADLHKECILERGRICEFYMTEAQWANFISSIGNGSGTPITFQRKREGDMCAVPGIKEEPTTKTHFQSELKKLLDEYLQLARNLSAQLDDFANNPASKVKKSDLKAMANMADHLSGLLALNVSYMETAFNKQMDKNINAAKMEIEGFLAGLTQSLGVQQLNNPPEAPALEEG